MLVTFQLIIRDSGGDPDLAVAAVRDLVLDHRVAAIIGPLSRVAAEAAAQEAEKLWVPIITLSQKEGVSEIGGYVFRYFLSNEQQARALADVRGTWTRLQTFCYSLPQR